MQRQHRNLFPKELKREILEEKGNVCAYCGGDADTLDHIIPYEKNPVHLKSNLVPSCRLCNSLAHDKVFGSFDLKRKYILQKRLERADGPALHRNFLIRTGRGTILVPNASGKPCNPESTRVWDEVLILARSSYAMKQSFRRVAKEDFDGRVSHAVIFRILRGIEPRSARVRIALGLPATFEEKAPGRDGRSSDGE